MICGNCKSTHGTVAEVKACYAGQTQGRAAHPTAERKATQAQLKFMRKLFVERVEGVTEISAEQERGLAAMTVKQASDTIDHLLTLAPKAGQGITPPAPMPHRQPVQPLTAELEVGTYTLVRHDGTWRTFSLAHPKWADGKLVASYLSGPDNELSFTACAFVGGGRVSMFKRFREDGQLAADLRQLLECDKHEAHERFLDQAEAYAIRSGKCLRCNHKLTVPASLHRGLGPVCAAAEGVA